MRRHAPRMVRGVGIGLVAGLTAWPWTPIGGQSPSTPHATAVFRDAGRQPLLARAFPEIDRLFRTFADTAKIPGFAYGVLIDGRLVHTGAAGFRDLAAKAPVDADTVFRIASMTKSFTAMAILRLRDDGRLGLDDPADRYVPELAALAYPTADSPRITIRHLLTHAEGFPEDNPWGDRQLAATDAEMTAMIRRGIPFSTSPGTAYEYSNFGFAILGRIVARAAGMPYARYVSAHILEPLGMAATTLDPGAVPRDRLALGYRWEDGSWRQEPLLPDGAFGAMGGMLTSTNDLARYVGFLMSAWPPRDGADTGPIRRSSAREMQQVWRPSPATVSRDTVDAPLRLNTGGYGFGLRVWQTCGLPHVVAHSGGLPGFGSHMRWLPEHGVALIAMGNLTYTGWGRVADEALDALARTGGLTARAPVASAALVEALDAASQLLHRWDDARARALAADNLFLDRPIERRRATFENLRARHGSCRSDPGSVVAENALRGSWTLGCDRGTVRLGVTLAPTVPPRVQVLEVSSALPLGEMLADALSRAAAAHARADEWPRLEEVLGPGVDAGSVRGQIKALAAWGTCGKSGILDSDGASAATVRWTCTRGAVDVAVTIEPGTGRIVRLLIRPAPGQGCSQ